jgi:hypothetical protein
MNGLDLRLMALGVAFLSLGLSFMVPQNAQWSVGWLGGIGAAVLWMLARQVTR